MIKGLPFFSLLAAFVIPAPLGASVVNIDFQVGASRGVMSGGAHTVIPSAGPVWNANGANRVATSLVTTTGVPTSLTLTAELYHAGISNDADAMFGDYVFGDATISGLNPGQEYFLVLYGGANIQNIFRVAQQFTTSSPAYGEVSCTYDHTVLPGVDGCDYVYGEVVADALGEISVEVRPGVMAGMQLALNPEPSVLVLQALAGLILTLRRRRS